MENLKCIDNLAEELRAGTGDDGEGRHTRH